MPTTILRTVATLAALAFSAAATPNFSGHWKLNTEKSKLDEPYREERTIDHKDPELTVSLKASIEGEEEESTAKYRTDGKETRNMIDGDPLFTHAHWDGDALVFESQIVSDTDTTELHDRKFRAAQGRPVPQAWDRGGGEVGYAHSTEEAVEQRDLPCGDGGGKGRSQRKR